MSSETERRGGKEKRLRDVEAESLHGGGELVVRECTTVEEFDACVALQREAFGLPELELSPRRHLVVSRGAGGWVLGAFDGRRLVGFVLHLVAVYDGEVGGYSHMMAVAKDFQNRGVGARLKWAQRERAAAEGRKSIRWTFDPVQARNAHFNLNRLGVVVRRYEENYYGTDYTTIAGEFGRPLGLDSDRLVVEWDLRSARVERLARGEASGERRDPEAAVEIPPDWGALLRTDPDEARRELLRVRGEFRAALARGLVCAAFERDPSRPKYLFFSE